MNYFHYQEAFETETGSVLTGLVISYHTYGRLNEDRSNVVWICHALTANSDAAAWWPGVVGEGCALDPARDFIVCANILGSCYGTTGPLSTDPATGKMYGHDFPLITIRDMVKAHRLLAAHLGIDSIHLLVGGSMGGYQALEWAAAFPQQVHQLFLIATSARETAWGIAIHTAQRMAIEADDSWRTSEPDAGTAGLKTARAIAMITYRSYNSYAHTQTDPDQDKLDHFRASSYITYQGQKLAARFNAYSYWTLSKAMDTHNLARGRADSAAGVLKTLPQRTLLIGIDSDLLCPPAELRYLSDHIPIAKLHMIGSMFGHDGFLTEGKQITSLLNKWLEG